MEGKMFYKFWLSAEERAQLNRNRRLRDARLVLKRLPEALSDLALHGDLAQYDAVRNKGGLKDQVAALIENANDKQVERFTETLTNKYWPN
jgi:hypothetical protein